MSSSDPIGLFRQADAQTVIRHSERGPNTAHARACDHHVARHLGRRLLYGYTNHGRLRIAGKGNLLHVDNRELCGGRS